MSCFRVPARGFGILGVMFIVLLLSGISCGGGGTTTGASKSVSNTEPATIYGLVWHDLDGDGVWDPMDHGEANIEVMFYDYDAQQTQYKDETDAVGVYQINIPGPRGDLFGRIQPTEYGQGYDTYSPGPQEIEVPEEEESVQGPTWRGYDS